MIDYISIYNTYDIPKSEFSDMIWSEVFNSDKHYYFKNINTVKIMYFPDTQRLMIQGKLIMLIENTQVKNLDDIYQHDTNRFINDVNKRINTLFRSFKIDIRHFTAARIDYCYNVYTPYVQAYLDFLNRAFTATDNGKRKNYALLNGLTGSVYIKPTAEYKANTRTNYTLNFYNKADWIENKRNSGLYISAEDEALAENILRLEVQASYTLLKSQTERNHIQRTFGDLLSFDIAWSTISSVYKRVFHADETADFYTYQVAKKQLSSLSAKKVLLRSAQRHSITGTSYTYGIKQIKSCGIYPYSFLPPKFSPSSLPNPLQLILEKVSHYETL